MGVGSAPLNYDLPVGATNGLHEKNGLAIQQGNWEKSFGPHWPFIGMSSWSLQGLCFKVIAIQWTLKGVKSWCFVYYCRWHTFCHTSLFSGQAVLRQSADPIFSSFWGPGAPYLRWLEPRAMWGPILSLPSNVLVTSEAHVCWSLFLNSRAVLHPGHSFLLSALPSPFL